jgi:RNase P/RNase MRP subunit p30
MKYMALDIVFPKGNEEEFIQMALRLGYSQLCCCYEFKNNSQVDLIRKNLASIQHKAKISIIFSLKARPHEIMKIKKMAQLIVCESSEKNRLVVEKNKGIILYNTEYQQKKDFMHHRNSGLNHILCRFAHENNITIGVSFSNLLHADKCTKAVLIGRNMQNTRLCRKYKVPMILGSFATDVYEMRAYYDLQSLGSVFGMTIFK